MKLSPTVYAPFFVLAALAAGCSNSYGPMQYPPPPPPPAYTTYGTLGDSVSIAAKLAEFRSALGGPLNAPNAPPADSGRREINWDGVPAALTDFAAVNAGLAAQFTTFSAKKLFMPVGSNVVDVKFRVVGTTTLGLVKGFG